jgi:hypothetical protein
MVGIALQRQTVKRLVTMSKRGASLQLLALVLILTAVGCPSTAPTPLTGTKKNGTATQGGPRLEIKQTRHEAGEADFSVANEYKFPVRNVGGEPLKLTLASKSCLCTDVVVPAEIAPGEEAAILVRWTPIPGQVGPHGTTCDIETNDPSKRSFRLEITGTVNPLVRIWPEDISYIDFYRFNPNDVKQRDLKVFSTRLSSFELGAKVTNAGIKVTTSKLDPTSTGPIGDMRPTCAYSVILETTKDLPPGSFFTDLILTLKLPTEGTRTISMRVYGEVNNSLFQVNPPEIEFKKPKVTDGESQKVRVTFFDPANKPTLKIVKSEPAFLQCDQPRALPGAAGQWEVVVRIPPNNPEVAKVQPDAFFEGHIVLQASDSEVQVPVRVKWIPPLPKEKH